jgi:hypothetical protein
MIASSVGRFCNNAVQISLTLTGVLFLATAADARPTTAQYVRPYGADAPWNIPVKNLPRHPQSDLYASRMYNYSPDRPGNFNLSSVGYTYPVFYVEDATSTYTVKGGYSTSNGSINGTKLPWNPNWSAASGSDAQIILLDPATGREWDLWQVSISGTSINISGGSLVSGSYFTKTDGWAYSRGVGIQYLAMLIRPEEIEKGVINHALSMPVANPDPTTHVAPATKTEGLSGSNSSKGAVPEGMRFALDVTDAQIESWVATKPSAYQRLARTIAHAMRDYGWFVTDHSGAAHIQLEADASAGDLWRAQGIEPGSSTLSDLLDGLITQSRIYTIVPSDQYPNQTLAPPNPPSGISVN